MGEPLDSTRPTRFGREPPRLEQTQQMNLRELEEAILWLQEQRTSMQTVIDAQAVTITELTARITTLEKKNG